MPAYDMLSLEIKGYENLPVKNRFIRLKDNASALAIILPGILYSCDDPLLYYTSNLLLERSTDVLQLWSDYTIPDYQSRSKEEQLEWLVSDANAMIRVAQFQREYQKLVLVGKSLGTMTMGKLLLQDRILSEIYTIWFTPLFGFQFVLDGALRLQKPGLFFGGTADRTYNANAFERIRTHTGFETLILDGVNHSLEFDNDTLRSIGTMKDIMLVVKNFLDQSVFS
jgi:hypothetical protein